MAATLDVAQALARLQVHSPSDGTSVYEHLVNLVSRVLEEKPTKPVDLLEASLLARKATFEAKESSPLVPIPVSGRRQHAQSMECVAEACVCDTSTVRAFCWVHATSGRGSHVLRVTAAPSWACEACGPRGSANAAVLRVPKGCSQQHAELDTHAHAAVNDARPRVCVWAHGPPSTPPPTPPRPPTQHLILEPGSHRLHHAASRPARLTLQAHACFAADCTGCLARHRSSQLVWLARPAHRPAHGRAHRSRSTQPGQAPCTTTCMRT